jgi:hypothetical protein
LRMDATDARDAALTVPAAAASASFDLPIMVFLPLTGRSGAPCPRRPLCKGNKLAVRVFNRGIFEWTVHEDEKVEIDVPEAISADCSLRPHKLFPIRSLIERHRRSHLNRKGGAARSCGPLARKRGR